MDEGSHTEATERDTGCAYWHACLSCPFPRCLEEVPGGPERAFAAERNALIRQLVAAGASPVAIADRFGLTRRSIYRIVGRVRTRQAVPLGQGRA